MLRPTRIPLVLITISLTVLALTSTLSAKLRKVQKSDLPKSSMAARRNLTDNYNLIATWPEDVSENYFVWNIDITRPNEGIADLRKQIPQPAGAKGFVKTDGEHLVFSDGTQIRLYGSNMLYQMPPKSEAPGVAARIASLGFNCMRLHHLDRSSPHGLIATPENNSQHPYSGDPWKIDPKMLDRLFFFISELKKNGVYVNLGIKSYRDVKTPKSASGRNTSGVVFVDSLKKEFYGSYDLFYPPMVKRYKKYVRTLLTTKNPYTGLSLAKDPCIAILEISNENGCIRSWDYHRTTMPPHINKVFQKRWKQWLKTRYASTEDLRKSWAMSKTKFQKIRKKGINELLKNANFIDGVKHWKAKNASAKPAIWDDYVAARKVPVAEVKAKSSDAEFSQTLRGGRSQNEVFRFEVTAYSSKPRDVTVSIIDRKGKAITPVKRISLGKEAEQYQVTLPVQGRSWKNRSRLVIDGLKPGATYFFGEVELGPVSQNGLGENESLDNPPSALLEDLEQRGPAAQRDGVLFRNWLAQEHFRDIYKYFREELGVKCPIVGTQDILKSDWFTNREMDVTDIHGYNSGPKPALLSGCPMISKCAMPIGRPRLITEYNYFTVQAPVERMILTAVAARIQDYAGTFQFAYNHEYTSMDLKPRHWNINRNPTAGVTSEIAWALYERGDLSPAKNTVLFEVSPRQFATKLVSVPGFNPDRINLETLHGIDRFVYMLHKVRVKLGQKDQLIQESILNPTAGEVTCDNGQVYFNRSNPDRCYMTVNTPRTCGAMGAIGGRALFVGPLKIEMQKNEIDYMAVFVTAMDGKDLRESQKMLLVAVGNQKMVLNDKHSSVNEGLSGVVCIHHANGSPKAYALGLYGGRMKQVNLPATSKGVEMNLSPKYKTLWYEISIDKK